jgi:uncharacterized SAM-binding protein YcdF (DUF218 family)
MESSRETKDKKDRNRAGGASGIYEPHHLQSTDGGKGVWIVLGIVSGCAAWLLTDLLGAPQIVGIGGDAGLIPFSLLGAALGWTQRFRRAMPALALLLLAATLVIAYTGVTEGAPSRFIRSDPIPKSADAVVILSAGVTADGYLTQQGIDRTVKGLSLIEQGVAPTLLFTREERKSRGVRFTNAVDQLRFVNLARINRVFTTQPVMSTHDEAVAVASVARHRGWHRIVLVTSPFHSRRACATFEHVGLTVSCVPSDSRDVALQRLIFPHDRIVAFGLWLYETVGTLRYRQQGWI